MEERKGLTSVPMARVACRMCLSTVQCAATDAEVSWLLFSRAQIILPQQV